MDDTSAVLIPHKWVPESDVEDSDEMDDGNDFQMAEVLPVVKDDVKEVKNKNKKKKKKKKKNNSKGVILGKLFLFQSNSLLINVHYTSQITKPQSLLFWNKKSSIVLSNTPQIALKWIQKSF